MSVIANPPSPHSREAVIRSLKAAVRLARSDESPDGRYASGMSAYDRWVGMLRNPGIAAAAENEAGALVSGNAHICHCLVDARRCAAKYLRQEAARFPDSIGGTEEALASYGSR